MPTPEQHALLSASSSHRWLHCPPSARLAEQFPAKTSTHAEAGRVAHAIAELKARKYFPDPADPMNARTYNVRLKKLQADPHYDKGMEESTDTYLAFLQETSMSFSQSPFVALETRVDYSEFAPEGFGTADCIMIGEGRICIIDYKNGAGVLVEAESNSQMMLYGLGALRAYAPIYGDSIESVLLAIVQPNAGGIRTWETTVDALRRWGEEVVRPVAELAYAGQGDYCAGEWCDKAFCPAAAQCSARARQMLGLEPLLGAKPLLAQPPGSETRDASALLTDAEIGDVLMRGRDLAAWVGKLEDYATTAILAGRDIPGFKVVEGRQSKAWFDQDAAFKTLQERGVAEALLYEHKPASVAGLEKILGKKVFAEAADGLVVRKTGKPTLVPASDKRPAYNAAAIAFGGGG